MITLLAFALMLPAPLGEGPKPPSRLAVIRQAPDFTLTTHEDKPLGLKDLHGKVLLVSFIFTTCNGTCPATTHRMSQIHDELTRAGLTKDERIHLLSISVDPARDTPEVLRGYRQLYSITARDWTFLTGPADDVEKTIARWGMWARPAANGQLDHPSRIFLVDTRGRIREIYNLAFLKPAWVIEDVRLLLREARP